MSPALTIVDAVPVYRVAAAASNSARAAAQCFELNQQLRRVQRQVVHAKVALQLCGGC